MTMIGNTATPSSPQPQPPGPDRWAPVFVWGVWALTLLAVLGYIREYGSNLPGWDEWYVVPYLVGERPLTASWLWSASPQTEQRIPLTRLTLVGLAKLTGCDFRAGMVATALTLGALAAALILGARRLRGRVSYSDAFFPLALLHFGHEEIMLQGLEINFATTSVLTSVVLLVALQPHRLLSVRKALLVSVCLLLLPLNGAPGVVLVPALALWLGYCGILWWRSPEPAGRRTGLCVVGLAAAPLLVVALYLVGLDRSGDVPTLSHDPGTLLRGAAQFLTVSLGPATQSLWPYSGFAVVALLLGSAAFLAAVWLRRPQERTRALGLLLVMGAVGSVALAVGWGRSGLRPDACFEPRYAVLALPALFGVYFMAGLYNPGGAGRLVQVGLFIFLCLVFERNLQEGLQFAQSTISAREDFQSDLLAGMPANLLAEKYTEKLNPSWDGEVHEVEERAVSHGLEALRKARIGMFKDMRGDVAFREVPVALTSADPQEMTWEDGEGVGSGSDSSLTFALESPRRVYAIRLTMSLTSGADEPSPRLDWRRSGQKDFPESGQSRSFNLGTETVTVWVDDTIDRFRIHPGDYPFVINITEIVLLVPPSANKPESGR
jgi:hypothetical protein